MPTVGLYLPPDLATIARLQPAVARCEHLEVVPETLWAPGGGFNTFLDLASSLCDRLGVPILAHGVGLSTSSRHPADDDRRRRWLDRLADTHRRLPFAWMTDHSGATVLAGQDVQLPVAVPLTRRSCDALRASLDDLAAIAGTGGVENSAIYALFDPPEAEPPFLAEALGPHALLLDLHNLAVLEQNHGLPAEDWLAQAPLEAVIEVHIAGGRGSEGLPVGRSFRLDSHDEAVPERVWQLLDAVLPRLQALRAVTLERLEGTVGDADVAGIVDDVERARERVRAATSRASSRAPGGPARAATLPEATEADHEAFDALLARVYRASDPPAVLADGLDELAGPLRAAAERVLAQPDALRLTALLVAQLRFSRLLRVSPGAEAAFEADPAGFTAVFRTWHRAVAPSPEPEADARAFGVFGAR